MNEVNAIVTGPEEAYDNEAEIWCANELMGVTVLHEGRLHLRKVFTKLDVGSRRELRGALPDNQPALVSS